MKTHLIPSSSKKNSLAYNGRKLTTVSNLKVKWETVEHFYARENDLVDFDPPRECPSLHTIDLSLNQLSGSLQFLHLVRNIRHIYVAGNGLTSLIGFSDLPHLESLFASNNDIPSLDGLGHLPALRTLALFDNDIANLKFFPHLPALYSLALAGNPVSTSPHYRSLCVAVCSDALGVIDTGEVTSLERAAVRRSFTGKVAFAATEGFVPSVAATDADTLAAEAAQFHLDLRHVHTEAMALKASLVELTGTFTEGDPVVLAACLLDTRPYEERKGAQFASTALAPVNFKVTGEAEAVDVVGSMTRWMASVPLQRVVKDSSVFFQGTVYVPRGEYEYRYCVDRVEKVSKQMPTATTAAGECNVYRVADPAEPPLNVPNFIYIRWLRTVSTNGFEQIAGAHGTTYTPTVDDVGRCLRCEVVAYEDNAYRGMYFDISPPIAVAAPRYTSFAMFPALMTEGMPSCLRATYAGGRPQREALSADDVVIARVAPDGCEVVLAADADTAGGAVAYTPVAEDVGCTIRVTARAVRADGVEGPPGVFESELVAAAPPQCVDMNATTPFVEGVPITVRAVYSGGREGASVLEWHRAVAPGLAPDDAINAETVPIEGAVGDTYVPTLRDVGHRLALNYRPVRDDGVAGDVSRFLTDPVLPAAPDVSNLRIVGDPVEGGTLAVQYDYFGGHPATPLLQWVRSFPVGRAMVGDGADSYVPTAEDVGAHIAVTVVPRRADGAAGAAAIGFTAGPVAPAGPRFTSVEVHGTPQEGAVVRAVVAYAGGAPGTHDLRWEVEIAPGTWEQRVAVAGSGGYEYACGSADARMNLRVVATPVRDDGVAGKPTAAAAGAVAPALPAAASVRMAPSHSRVYRVGVPVTGAFSYIGGRPGLHGVRWVRRTPLGEQVVVHETTIPPGAPDAAITYTPTASDVLCSLALVVTPVRDDGVEGLPQRSTWSPAVQPREGGTLAHTAGRGGGATSVASVASRAQSLLAQHEMD